MNKAKLIWRERTSESTFIASIWACSTPVETTRTVLADPCISIALVRERDTTSVVFKGPETKPHFEFLVPGYMCITIRLQPGVILRGFPVQKFINSSLVLPTTAAAQFWFEGTCLRFPGFDDAELLIDQLYDAGYISYDSSSERKQTAGALSPRTYFRLVKRTTGLSPYQLRQLQRIHQALRLLKQGVPVAAVATELDFVDQAHLTHASRQFFGHTPKQLLHVPQIP